MGEANDRYRAWLDRNSKKEQWLEGKAGSEGRYRLAGRYEGKKRGKELLKSMEPGNKK